MTTKQKAKEIVSNFFKYSNGYVGSSFMTDTEFPDAKLSSAKSIAKDVVREILETLNEREIRDDFYVEQTGFYNQVLMDIDQVESV